MKTLLFRVVPALFLLSPQAPGGEHLPLSMRDAERIALENHPLARSGDAALAASRARFWRGISPPPPSLSLDYSYVPLGRPLTAFGEKTWEVSQELDFPLTTIARGASLSREVDAAESDLASARLEVAAGARLAYVRLLAAQRRLALSAENLAIADSFALGAEARKRAGEGTHLELLTARVQRTQAANAMETARAAMVIAASELRTALGWEPDHSMDDVVLTDSLSGDPVDLHLDSLQVHAQALNPRIAASESRFGSAEAERTAAWMSALPSLSFSYYRQTVGDNPNLYGAKFGISVPLWFLMDNRGRVQEAGAGARNAAEALRSARSTVALEVTSAYTAYANSKRQLDLQLREILPQAEEVFRVASVSYHAGEATYLEFLQALQGLNTVRNAALDALVDFNTALIQLERSVGKIQ